MSTVDHDHPRVQDLTFDRAVERARSLIVPGQRRILGITGSPGAGKSTLASALVNALAPDAVLVTMDGFHLANSVLNALGRRDRKGAPDTFDISGYALLLARLRAQGEGIVYAPEFNRAMDESIGSAVPVMPDTPLIVTEGNYLLVDEGGWGAVRESIDESWFVAPPEDLRLERLIRRHEQFGLSAEAADAWARGTDQKNAELVAATRTRADLVLSVADIPLA
ncbi:MAG: Panthothenate kinase related protein [Cryobacterium sp.]|jgi:pantothenate kinase|nr:Panthothenate kinase related protein [Cryobacterium sp.]